ncbi:hypothetical protein FRB95_006219 [Tulasnella sp. JGI-2019a]|nr:hypothetical protein FRB95_006219 [Tulasnella sp. JGI-2019a]
MGRAVLARPYTVLITTSVKVTPHCLFTWPVMTLAPGRLHHHLYALKSGLAYLCLPFRQLQYPITSHDEYRVSQTRSPMSNITAATEVQVHGPFCSARKRALGLSSDDKKIFILHDEDQNSTIAQHRTMGLASTLDGLGVTTYTRNGPFTSLVTDPAADPFDPSAYRRSWLGQKPSDVDRSTQFIRVTCDKKGPYYGLLAFGRSIAIAEAVAAAHGVQVENLSRDQTFDADTSYPLLFVTAQKAYFFVVDMPSEANVDWTPSLPTSQLIGDISEAIRGQSKLFGFPKPTMAQIRAAKQVRKAALVERSRMGRLPKELRTKLCPIERKPPIPTTFSWPFRPSTVKEWTWNPDSGASRFYNNPNRSFAAPVSNYITAPRAEPVTPCSLASLEPMIQWLNKNDDIDSAQEPRIDFTKGSILGKTSRGGGVSVDLCKQVVGPVGIGPIMDAVGINDNIDRFLLGNNVVSDKGAEVIAEFIRKDQKKANGGRVYNYYLAGNSITSEGIAHIASALTDNPVVTALWLKRNNLGADGALALSDMLAHNDRLEVLDLVMTNIGDTGAEHIFRALTQNPKSALKHLYFGASGHGPAIARAAAEYMKTDHCQLRTLFMGMSRLGDDGALALAEGLREQKTIERLGLSSCLIGDKGAIAIANALKNGPGGKSIVSLDLGWRRGTLELGEEGNFISHHGAVAAGELLLHTGLRSLDLTNSRMSFDGMEYFVKQILDGNDRALDVRLRQRFDKMNRNVSAESRAKEVCKNNWTRFNDEAAAVSSPEAKAEVERIKDALDPQHIREIYSVYRGNM